MTTAAEPSRNSPKRGIFKTTNFTNYTNLKIDNHEFRALDLWSLATEGTQEFHEFGLRKDKFDNNSREEKFVKFV